MAEFHPPSQKVQKLAEDLIGTTGDAYLLDRVEALTLNECKALDRLAFECTGCGWWCAESEKNDDPVTKEWVCNQCYDDREPQEDDVE